MSTIGVYGGNLHQLSDSNVSWPQSSPKTLKRWRWVWVWSEEK